MGLRNYVGFKNDRVILVGDELALMPEQFLEPITNLRKNSSFQFIGLGNPKDRHDTLGKAAEPEHGWDSVEGPQTRVWKTKFSGRVAVQLCGYDTPNGDPEYPKGLNPFQGLITPEQIERDKQDYGEGSIQFQMMNLGVMPRTSLEHRVVTIQMCESCNAFDPVVWGSGPFVDVVGLDAAYSIDGDANVLTHARFGKDALGKQVIAILGTQEINLLNNGIEPEDQIAKASMEFCIQRGVPPENFGLDSTGRGTLTLALARTWSNAFMAVEFGGDAFDRPTHAGSRQLESEAYKNRVTALWYASRRVIEAKQMRQLPREYAAEAAMRLVLIVGKTKVQVEPKTKTKERMKCSPDHWDSLVVMLEVARRRGFQIAGQSEMKPGANKPPQWALDTQSKLFKIHQSKMLAQG
jgi:hypothetical protein